MGKIRKLVEVDDNLEPILELTEIFGRFPIDCSKCFKEIGSKNEMVSFCEISDFENFAWMSPLHTDCANQIAKENGEVLVPVSLMKELDPHRKFHKIFLNKKDDDRITFQS